MKEKIIPFILAFLLFSAPNAFSEPSLLDDNLKIHVPCAEYQGICYKLIFEIFSPTQSASLSSEAFYWKLLSMEKSLSDGSCIKIQEDTLNIIIPEIQYRQNTYALSLHCEAVPEAPDNLIWKMGTVFELAPAEMKRKTAEKEETLTEMVKGLNEFNIAFYKTMAEEGKNLFYSPFSISSAFAMSYAGAKDKTADQMKEVLKWRVDPPSLHSGFNYLDLEFLQREMPDDDQDVPGFSLNISNNIWGQNGFTLLPEYLNTLSVNYGARLALLDFLNNPGGSRETINSWVSDQTREKIKDLIPPGAIGSSTRLVLTNTIYFNAPWQFPFEPENTVEAPFNLSEDESVNLPMMTQTEMFNYAESEEFQAVELFYKGQELSMLIILPRQGMFSEFEQNMNREKINSIIDSLSSTNVHLELPAFKLTPESISLKSAMQQMGLTLAFTPEADFSGITDAENLFISDVIHKAFIRVDEAGTEAAAATAVTFEVTSFPSPPVQMHINRPFIFMIRDLDTKVVLFMGRLVTP